MFHARLCLPKCYIYYKYKQCTFPGKRFCSLLCHETRWGGLCCVSSVGGMCETKNFYRSRKLEVNYSNELTVFVDLSDFNATWPKCSSDISAPKCVRLLRKSKYFSCDVPSSNSSQKIFYCPTLKGIFYATNKKIEKASHTLLAHHLLSDIVQSVWLSAASQRLVTQFSRYGHLCV